MIRCQIRFAALAFVAVFVTAQQVRGANVSVTIDNVSSPTLVGELFQFDLMVLNAGAAVIEIPKLGPGLATGRINIEVTDPDGQPLPSIPVQQVQAQPADVDSLRPAQGRSWSGLTTGFMNLRPARSGRHKIRVRVGTSAGVVETVAMVDVVMPPEAGTRLILAVPLAGRPGAPDGSVARVDLVELSGKVWVFYRRAGRTDRPLVVRLGRLASLGDDNRARIVAVGDAKVIEAAFARDEGGLAFIRLDPIDGSPMKMPSGVNP